MDCLRECLNFYIAIKKAEYNYSLQMSYMLWRIQMHIGHVQVTSSLSPVFTKDRVIQDNLLQKLDELIGKVSRHEGLDCDRHLLRILSLRQGCLDNLQQRGTTDLMHYSCCFE